MSRVRAAERVEGTVAEAEALWYDTARWPTFVDGFGRVARTDGDWPREGTLTWDSRPGGRGRVIERVTWFSAREGQDAAVEDERLTGTQRVRFTPEDGESVLAELELSYALKEARPGMVVVDLLFVRRALRDSLRRTLHRFATELDAERELG